MTETKVPSEHIEQALLVQWFRRSFPDVLIYATPNGGARAKAAAGRLKVEGVVAGIPDLFVPAWRLWIEMKRIKGGVVSAEQRAMMDYLQSVGYRAIVCKGAENAKAQILEFLNDREND